MRSFRAWEMNWHVLNLKEFFVCGWMLEDQLFSMFVASPKGVENTREVSSLRNEFGMC